MGKTLEFEGREWRISGTFSAGGAAFESEVWCRLDELQQAMKRQDLSLVAVTLAPGADFANLDLFCMERLDLELQALAETEYYASLQKDYGPVRMLAWLVVLLVSGAGVFAGLNTMYGSVVGRIRELATLQTIGFVRRAMLVSLVQEGVIPGGGGQFAGDVRGDRVRQRGGGAVHDGRVFAADRRGGRADRLRRRAVVGRGGRDSAGDSRVADADRGRAEGDVTGEVGFVFLNWLKGVCDESTGNYNT